MPCAGAEFPKLAGRRAGLAVGFDRAEYPRGTKEEVEKGGSNGESAPSMFSMPASNPKLCSIASTTLVWGFCSMLCRPEIESL